MARNKGKCAIVDEWTAGFRAAWELKPRLSSKSVHWLAGWDTGYDLQLAKTERLNAYLTDMGHGVRLRGRKGATNDPTH